MVINSGFYLFNKQYDINCKIIVQAKGVYCAHQTWAITSIHIHRLRTVNSSSYYFETGILTRDAIGVIWRFHVSCESDGESCRLPWGIDRFTMIGYSRADPASGNCRVSSQFIKKVLRHLYEYKHQHPYLPVSYWGKQLACIVYTASKLFLFLVIDARFNSSIWCIFFFCGYLLFFLIYFSAFLDPPS